jgi:hypothetical protein
MSLVTAPPSASAPLLAEALVRVANLVAISSVPGQGRSGLGGRVPLDSSANYVLFYSFSHKALAMDFLSSSSIIMQRPSFPEKKMKGM